MASEARHGPDFAGEGVVTPADWRLLAQEVDTVALYIGEVRAAINGLGVLDITEHKLNAVKADIHDVKSQTRSAAETVLETAESLLAAEGSGPAYRALVDDHMLRLMEACSFQDLTGQRLSRVAETLNAMEERLKRFAALVRPQGNGAVTGAEELRRDAWRRSHLVNGPGGKDAMDQDMIDALLAGSG